MEDPRQEWLDAIYREYRRSTYSTAYHLLGNTEMAEDITQEAFAVLARRYDKVKGHPNIKRWLSRTVANLVLNEEKRAYHDREVALKPEHIPTVEDAYFQGLASSFPPGLSEKDRKLLCLCFEKDLPQEEIAAMLGCSVEAFRMRLSRAKARYKKLREKNSSG